MNLIIAGATTMMAASADPNECKSSQQLEAILVDRCTVVGRGRFRAGTFLRLDKTHTSDLGVGSP